jgi:hypothetical protein
MMNFLLKQNKGIYRQAKHRIDPVNWNELLLLEELFAVIKKTANALGGM